MAGQAPPSAARCPTYYAQTVNGLLQELDGIEARVGVVVVGACNHPEGIDPALVRAGRLDRTIHIGLPDEAALQEILRHHLGADLAGVDLGGAARAAFGAAGADCARWVRGARRRARAARRAMELADLMAEIGPPAPRSPALLRATAVHEAGHAVAATLLLPGHLRGVTIRPMGLIGGGVLLCDMREEPVSAGRIRAHLAVMLAGRAAEAIILGEASDGAGGPPDSDLAKATLLATHMVSALGMAGDLLWIGEPSPAGLAALLGARPDLESKVRALLAEADHAVRDLLLRRVAVTEAVAAALVEHETLSAADVVALVNGHNFGRDITAPGSSSIVSMSASAASYGTAAASVRVPPERHWSSGDHTEVRRLTSTAPLRSQAYSKWSACATGTSRWGR